MINLIRSAFNERWETFTWESFITARRWLELIEQLNVKPTLYTLYAWRLLYLLYPWRLLLTMFAKYAKAVSSYKHHATDGR